MRGTGPTLFNQGSMRNPDELPRRRDPTHKAAATHNPFTHFGETWLSRFVSKAQWAKIRATRTKPHRPLPLAQEARRGRVIDKIGNTPPPRSPRLIEVESERAQILAGASGAQPRPRRWARHPQAHGRLGKLHGRARVQEHRSPLRAQGALQRSTKEEEAVLKPKPRSPAEKPCMRSPLRKPPGPRSQPRSRMADEGAHRGNPLLRDHPADGFAEPGRRGPRGRRADKDPKLTRARLTLSNHLVKGIVDHGDERRGTSRRALRAGEVLEVRVHPEDLASRDRAAGVRKPPRTCDTVYTSSLARNGRRRAHVGNVVDTDQ